MSDLRRRGDGSVNPGGDFNGNTEVRRKASPQTKAATRLSRQALTTGGQPVAARLLERLR